MSRQRSRTNHGSHVAWILLGAFTLICFAERSLLPPDPNRYQQHVITGLVEEIAYPYWQYPETEYPDCDIIGIHLGKTFASVAIVRNGSVEMIPNSDGNHVTPNTVKFTDDEILIGEELEVDARHTIFDMERLIGRKFNDRAVQDAIKDLPFRVFNAYGVLKIKVELSTKVLEFSPEEITAMVLGKLRKQADEYLGVNITDAVITIPADSGDNQREATEKAARLAGLNVIRMISEPIAAILSYDLHKLRLGRYVDKGYHTYEEPHVLVYNLGVRSFSASILFLEEGVFETIATVRDEHIGSTGFKDSLFADTIALVKKALLDYHLTETDIDYIIITEGSEEVAHKLEEYFGKAPLDNIDQYEVIAHGAALQARILGNEYNGNGGCLVDAIPLALGIETNDGIMYPIIKRGTSYPTKKIEYFTTAFDDQTTVLIQVYEGGRPYTNISNFLGEFELEGIPKTKKGVPKIDVTFEFWNNDMLRVTATCLDRSITYDFFSSSDRLHYTELVKLIEDSNEHHEQDKNVDFTNRIGNYATNKETRNEKAKMRMVQRHLK